jgi:hypothetical protein
VRALRFSHVQREARQGASTSLEPPRLKEPNLDVELWSETLDESGNVAAHLPQVSDSKGREGLLRIAQKYLDGLVTIHLHLRIRAGGLDQNAHEFCAVIASHRGDVGDAEDFSYALDGSGIPGELSRVFAFAPVGDADGTRVGESPGDVDEAVLVHIVQPRKKGKVRLRRAVSVLKGLDVLDKCPIIHAYTAKHPKARLIPLPAFVDGELRLAGGAASPEEYELPDEIVKRGPQVVSELPDDEPETGIGRLAVEAKDVLACVAVELTQEAGIFLVKPGLEGVPFSVERGQVLIRAFQSPIDGF